MTAGSVGWHPKYVTLPQATNIIDTFKLAKLVALPLVAHLTIHWAFTYAGVDPDRLREGPRGSEQVAMTARNRARSSLSRTRMSSG
jgi:hypothetical protein